MPAPFAPQGTHSPQTCCSDSRPSLEALGHRALLHAEDTADGVIRLTRQLVTLAGTWQAHTARSVTVLEAAACDTKPTLIPRTHSQDKALVRSSGHNSFCCMLHSERGATSLAAPGAGSLCRAQGESTQKRTCSRAAPAEGGNRGIGGGKEVATAQNAKLANAAECSRPRPVALQCATRNGCLSCC